MRRVFVLPGAKVDRVIEALRVTPEIEMVLCRNEQTAAFMAAGAWVGVRRRAARTAPPSLYYYNSPLGNLQKNNQPSPPGHGRRTGRAGVVIVTSGPGVTNLATAMVTATCEGDPVVAFGGNVACAQRYKRTHQSMDNSALMRPVSKFVAEIPAVDCIAEVVANAFRAAEGCASLLLRCRVAVA